MKLPSAWRRLPPSYVAARVGLQILVVVAVVAGGTALVLAGMPGTLWELGGDWWRVVRELAFPW